MTTVRCKQYLIGMMEGDKTISLPAFSTIVGVKPIGRVGQITNVAVIVLEDPNQPLQPRTVVLAHVDVDGVSASFDATGLVLRATATYGYSYNETEQTSILFERV